MDMLLGKLTESCTDVVLSWSLGVLLLGLLEGLWCELMSTAAYDSPWAMYLELQSNPQFVGASAGLQCVPRLPFTSTKSRYVS